MTKESAVSLGTALRTLSGRTVTSIEFIHDYMQLRFGEATLTLNVYPKVIADNNVLRRGDPGYLEALHELLGATVRDALADDLVASVVFENRIRLSVDLKDRDFSYPERLVFTDEDGHIWVA